MKTIVKIDEQTYEVEIESLASRPIKAIVDGQVFEIWPEENGHVVKDGNHKSQRVKPPEPIVPKVTPVSVTSSQVLAPIPGVINAINVSVGEAVKAGQQLCVLEAMKMNNSIRSTRDGVIARINISVGQHVKHHDVLFEFEN